VPNNSVPEHQVNINLCRIANRDEKKSPGIGQLDSANSTTTSSGDYREEAPRVRSDFADTSSHSVLRFPGMGRIAVRDSPGSQPSVERLGTCVPEIHGTGLIRNSSGKNMTKEYSRNVPGTDPNPPFRLLLTPCYATLLGYFSPRSGLRSCSGTYISGAFPEQACSIIFRDIM